MYMSCREPDNIINVAGHRLSTGGIEEVLASHHDVAECAVVGVHDDLKGQIPVGFLVLKKGVDRDPHEIVGRGRADGAAEDRPRGSIQDGSSCAGLAQDAIRKSPARHDTENC
jgi:acyl-CoA synthetase (AMP-forming)/AMP-acid ligase II